MSVLPLPPMVLKARRAVLAVGLLWPIVAVVISGMQGGERGTAFAFVGIIFLGMIFLAPVLILAVILPTFTSRMCVVPPVLVFIYFIVSGGSRLMPYMLLWITTFTAITLCFPQWSSIEAFFRRGPKR